MRTALGLAAAMIFSGSFAFAQTLPAPTAPAVEAPTSRCAAVPPTPASPPDGATATADQMRAAETEFMAWNQAAIAALACRRGEAEQAQAIAAARTGDYNTHARTVETAVAAWTTEATEFNARAPQRGPSRRRN